MPYVGDDYLKLLDLTAEGKPQKYNDMLKDYHRLLSDRAQWPDYRRMTRQAVEHHLKTVRERLMTALGVLPHTETDPPEMHNVGDHLHRDGYSVQKIWFESLPGRPVTGLIYRSEPVPPRDMPGILIVHGHGVQGKAQPATQQRCIGLARRGFVVLAIDTAGLGERKPAGHNNFALFAAGSSPQALLLRDNMRALDLLTYLPGVEFGKIGVTGSSGGGTQTMFLAALDDRVTSAVPTATVCAYNDHMAHSNSDYCSCEAVPGLIKFGDIGDILALCAPRHLLVLSPTRDLTFPIQGARASYLRALDAYKQLGVGEAIEKWEAYTPHAYSRSLREAMYTFFERTLMNRHKATPEDFPTPIEDPDGTAINVLDSGRAAGHTVFPADDLNAYTHRAAQAAREHQSKNKLEQFREYWSGWRPALMGDPLKPPGTPRLLKRSKQTWGELAVDTLLIESECGILVPAVIARRPDTPATAPLVVYLAKAGKDEIFFSRRARVLIDAGYRLAGFDVRGTGETAYDWAGDEETAALNAIMTGRALFDGRAMDVSICLDLFRKIGLIYDACALWITDSFSLYGLQTALDFPTLQPVVVDRTILSLAAAEGFNESGLEALFVPGLLKVADLPQLMALVCPRPLLVLNPVGPRGKMLTDSEAQTALSWTKLAFSSEKAAGQLKVLTNLGDDELNTQVLAAIATTPPGGLAGGPGGGQVGGSSGSRISPVAR
ncbi:MAG TPA: hypothetical protein VL860_05015 [Planctomycetota bacterium]|nr:hypothetical protein [Planctomycetota bacterium]